MTAVGFRRLLYPRKRFSYPETEALRVLTASDLLYGASSDLVVGDVSRLARQVKPFQRQRVHSNEDA